MGWQIEEWALDAMEERGMNEREFCNRMGLELEDIMEDDGEDD